MKETPFTGEALVTTAYLSTSTRSEELMAHARWACLPIVGRAPVDPVRRVAIRLA